MSTMCQVQCLVYNNNYQTHKKAEKCENKQPNIHVIQKENRELMEQKIFKKVLAEFD